MQFELQFACSTLLMAHREKLDPEANMLVDNDKPFASLAYYDLLYLSLINHKFLYYCETKNRKPIF